MTMTTDPRRRQWVRRSLLNWLLSGALIGGYILSTLFAKDVIDHLWIGSWGILEQLYKDISIFHDALPLGERAELAWSFALYGAVASLIPTTVLWLVIGRTLAVLHLRRCTVHPRVLRTLHLPET